MEVYIDLVTALGLAAGAASSSAGAAWWLGRRFAAVDRRLWSLEAAVQEIISDSLDEEEK